MLKAIYLVLGVVLLMIGVVGLLFPVIPGILFIALAVFLLGKASHRIKAFADKNRHVRLANARFEAMGEVPVADRVKLTGLMVAESLVAGAAAITEQSTRLASRLSRQFGQRQRY